MDGVERGCFDHLRQEQGQIGAADGVVDEGTHGAAAASPIRCHGVCQIPTSMTRPNVGAAEIGLKKAPIASAAFTAGEMVGPPSPRSQTGHRAQLSTILESGDDDEWTTRAYKTFQMNKTTSIDLEMSTHCFNFL